MFIRFKCPDCEDSLMAYNEEGETYVCAEEECQKELTEAEVDELFEDDQIVAVLDEEDEDDLDEKEDGDDDESDDDEDEEDDEEEENESFLGFSNRATWAANLILQNEYKEFKAVNKVLTEAEEDADKGDLLKTHFESVNTDDFEDIDFDNVDWNEVSESIDETRQELADIVDDLTQALTSEDDEDGIDEETRGKVVQIFEAAVAVKYNNLKASLTQKNQNDLDVAISEKEDELIEEMSSYLEEVVAEWMTENKLAIEHGIKIEKMEGFMEDLRSIFEKNYIDIPEERYDVLEDLSMKIDNLKEELEEAEANNQELVNKLNESRMQEIVAKLSEGLAETQAEKLSTFAENLDYESDEQFESTLSNLKESFLKKSKTKEDGDLIKENEEEDLDEEHDEIDEDNPIAVAARNSKRAKQLRKV